MIRRPAGAPLPDRRARPAGFRITRPRTASRPGRASAAVTLSAAFKAGSFTSDRILPPNNWLVS